MAIDGINGINGADEIKRRDWRTASLSEIKSNLDEVKKDNPEVADWAMAMAAAGNDNVTYEMTGGDVETLTKDLESITNDNIAVNELPESGQAATPGAVRNADEAEREAANPELGPEDQVQPEGNTMAPPKGEEVPEEEKPEIKPEEDVEEQQKEEQVNADVKVDDLEEARRKRLRGENS